MIDHAVADTRHLDAIREVRRPVAEASHAPGFLYASPDVYRLEVERLFRRDWLLVGREEELAEPGDFLTLRIAGEPIVIARARDGALHAFYNMCAHRGVEVVQGCGQAKNFSCPYHGWTYDLDGRLLGAGYMKGAAGFDARGIRLQPIRLETWRRNIFVSFDPSAPPLAEHVAEWEKDFAFLRPEACRLGNRLELRLDCNWKFVPENLMDFYHVGVLHAGTFGAKFSWNDEQVQLKSRGGIAIFYNAGPPTPGAQPLLGKMPWLEEKPVSFSCTGFLPPNCTLFGRIDCVRLMIAWPEGPGRSRTVIYHLFPEEFFERPGVRETLKIYHDYQLTVLEEDRSMIESMQKAMSSPAYRPGRMSPLEKPLHHYLNGYIDRVLGPAETTR
ncbi:MAG: aromatic ring-hydroxylating dioxygenase subunit alpha [Candidatus Rokubacteria bacterium]|nr:aromatic ring-hydroxylating dioxygenase subunit alpha [Candidatus Rokubacteria bacterium]